MDSQKVGGKTVIMYVVESDKSPQKGGKVSKYSFLKISIAYLPNQPIL